MTQEALEIGFGELLLAKVVHRPNRFVVIILLGGKEVRCHLADSGRLKELIYPGNKVLVREAVPRPGRTRLTSHDLVLAAAPGPDLTWVSVDTRYPTKLLAKALRARALAEFREYSEVRPEYSFRHEPAEPSGKKVPRSRLDFLLKGEGVPPALVEAKSVTLCISGVGFFPDAPSSRGTRHLRELVVAAEMGYKSFVIFIAQREDIEKVTANAATDPDFADALRTARESGVTLLAYRTAITPSHMVLDPRPLPVLT